MSVISKSTSQMKQTLVKKLRVGDNLWDWSAGEFRNVVTVERVQRTLTMDEVNSSLGPMADGTTITFEDGTREIVESSEVVMVQFQWPWREEPWRS